MNIIKQFTCIGYLSLYVEHGCYVVSHWGTIHVLVSIQVLEVVVHIYTCLIGDIDLF
jgi:hypothetical protein